MKTIKLILIGICLGLLISVVVTEIAIAQETSITSSRDSLKLNPGEKVYRITNDGQHEYLDYMAYRRAIREEFAVNKAFKVLSERSFYLSAYDAGILSDYISYDEFTSMSTTQKQDLLIGIELPGLDDIKINVKHDIDYQKVISQYHRDALVGTDYYQPTRDDVIKYLVAKKLRMMARAHGMLDNSRMNSEIEMFYGQIKQSQEYDKTSVAMDESDFSVAMYLETKNAIALN